MAEYSNNYTQNTTSYTFGTEVYKFSRTVDVINPSAIDNSCIYCGAENGSMYDYYPTYNLGTAEKAIMNNKWSASGGTFNFQKSAKPTPYNITFVKCGETGTAAERGRNTVYQIGKTIYNKASSATNSSMRVLNPTDIRKLIFKPSFEGYTASPSSTFTSVDLKYLMEHPDDFFVQQMTMNVYGWNGSTFTNDSEIQSIRPCIVGDNYFMPVINVLGRHIFGMTDYNSRRDYTQSFYGTYDKDNMPMSFVPILTDETLTYDPDGSSGGGATANNNKWKWSYNYYNSSYEIHAPARQVLQLMAYCGCYFIDNSYSTSGKTLNTMWNDEHIYLGEMKEGARTTGNFIKGTDLLMSDTINKGAYSSQTDFNPSPSPSGDDDDYESMTTGFASTLSGCTKYYLMSPLDIVTLIRDYYTHAFAGSTLSNSIISCYLCGLSPTAFLSTDTPAPIKIPTVAGEAIFESANSYKAIGAVLNKIAVGNIAVPRMNNDFHDFSPYTIYEVFIPYCGWISLPDTVAGKHIYVEFHVDVRTMAGKAIVLIGADDGGKATCAEMSMNFGASTPFAVIEAGLERQAAVTAGIQTAIGTAAAITGIRSGHSALTVSSIGTAAQGIANGMMSSMANYTQVQGKAGDTSDFANGRQCYLKISWAKTDEVVNNSRFGHSVGYLCNTVGKIKDFKGLTVCANPHVNGIDCTESEKEEIKRLLEDGIIVN